MAEGIVVAPVKHRDPVDRGSHCKVCLVRVTRVCVEPGMQLT